MNFKYFNFKQDIIHESLDLLIDKTILVFPTEKNKKLAIKEFQNTWNFSEHKFYSMDEFKRKCFLPDLPIVSDLKQKLAFYNCLSESDKEYFRITNYFDSISISNQFFAFFQELTDEMIGDIDIKKLGYNSNIPEEIIIWQEKMYQIFIQVKQKYKSEINSKKYTDRMFVYVDDKLNTDFVNSFNRIVFVNQFYYSKLEKQIICHLDKEKEIEVLMLFQADQKMINETELDINTFSLKDMINVPYKTEKIEIYQAETQFLQLITGLGIIDRNQSIRKIVDGEFYKGLYKEIVSEKYFDINNEASIKSSNIYKFFYSWKMLITEVEDRKISIHVLYSLITTDVFTSYYEITSEQRTLIESLMENGLRYISIKSINNKKFSTDFELLIMSRSYELFKKFINSIDVSLLKDKYLDRVIEAYFDVLLELAEIVKEKFLSDEINNPLAYLDLLLGNFTERGCILTTNIQKPTQLSVDSLLDTRNMQYPEVLFFNVTEGIIPTAKSQQLLFNERQRKMLGLKDYDDIILREKYYFYRLVLSAKNVFIISIESEESNTQTSSFVEELKLHMPNCIKISDTISETNMYQFFLKHSLSTDREVLIKKKNREPLEFMDNDLPNQMFTLTFKSLSNLINCSYRYYLENVVKLKVIKRDKTDDIDMNVLGTIIHDVFSKVACNVKDEIDSKKWGSFKDILRDNSSDTKETIQKIIQKFSDSIPNRYQNRYMNEILVPLLWEALNGFFVDILDRRINIENINAFIPENSFNNKIENEGIKISKNVLIKSRADLRIETKDNKGYIIDYKTGKSNDPKQLDMYELFYYSLRPDKRVLDSVERAFYNVMESTYEVSFKRLLSADDIINGVEKIIASKEYERAKKRSFCQYCNYKEICGKS